MENDGKVIALLIDAENVSPKYIKTIIDEVSMYGTPPTSAFTEIGRPPTW